MALNLQGRELGGCRLNRVVGEGGMGEVYLAEQLNAGNRAVAVKVVRPDVLSVDAEDVEDIRERFKREVSLAANFNNPNILPVYYSGAEKDYLYIVMMYAEEGSLSDAIRGRSRRSLTLPLDVAMTTDIVSQVASALQYIHDRGVVHRDVKPGNVLIQVEPSGHWRMMLADFGVARGPDSNTARTQVAGTFTYMAPEQFDGKFSPATDQYALAVMTYQLLAGRPPFEGELGALTRAHMYDPPPPLRKFNPAVPPQMEAAILQGLAKDPARRFANVTAFARAVESGADAGMAPVAPPPLTERAAPAPLVAPQWPGGPAGGQGKPRSSGGGMSRLWLAVLAVIVLLTAVVGAGTYFSNQQHLAAVATETAQANATLTQQAQASASSSTTAGVTATTAVTVTPNGPTPTTASSTPPPGVGSQVFASPAPTCDGQSSPTWAPEGANVTCVGATQVDLSSPKAGTLACLSAQKINQNDGYLQTTVDPQSGKAEVGVRQGVGNTTTGTSFNITGYYLAVDGVNNAYVVYSVDAAGHPTTLQQGSLIGAPPQQFPFGLMYQGTSLTPYINGHAYPSVTDSSFNGGWVAICTDGASSFNNVQLYNVGG